MCRTRAMSGMDWVAAGGSSDLPEFASGSRQVITPFMQAVCGAVRKVDPHLYETMAVVR
ncbi:MAG: hypothetical protein JOZ58_12795 [Acetobacteraceae bacterium]|nr:hypothetical protein [Acetobacteraceae bacterium]